MNYDFAKILDECIDLMNSGQTIDECLRLHADYADKLEPLLRTVGELQDRIVFVPSEAAKAEGRLRLQQARYDLNQTRSLPKESLLQRLFGHPKLWAPITAVLLLILLGFGLSTIFDGNGTAPTTIANPTATTPSETIVADIGILEIRVTDAPAHDISAVNMTIGNIEVHRGQIDGQQDSDQEASDDIGWETVIQGSRSFELLELRGGIEKVLGSKQLKAGHYTQIRLDIEEVIVTVDGENRIATLPSGKLKLVSSLTIEEGMKTALILDFDAEQSVVITGQGKVIFKPVVKLTTTTSL